MQHLFQAAALALIVGAHAGRHSDDAIAAAPTGDGAPHVAEEGEKGFDHRHTKWDVLMREYVNEEGFVDYRGLAQVRSKLDAYTASLESVTAREYRVWSLDERTAFWINAYNAYTIQLILDNYPVKSIRKLGGFFSSVFDKRYIPLQHLAKQEATAKVNGKKDLSLGELEHGVLGRMTKGPMFHFAIVCASYSCPELRNAAYTAETLDTDLSEQARIFFADAKKNDVTISRGKISVSKIFKWSDHDFAEHAGGARGVLRDFAPDAVAKHEDLASVKLSYRDYDWSLNEWKRR